jgi:hypothetical protein
MLFFHKKFFFVFYSEIYCCFPPKKHFFFRKNNIITRGEVVRKIGLKIPSTCPNNACSGGTNCCCFVGVIILFFSLFEQEQATDEKHREELRKYTRKLEQQKHVIYQLHGKADKLVTAKHLMKNNEVKQVGALCQRHFWEFWHLDFGVVGGTFFA